MSEWYEPEDDDIDVLQNEREVHIFVKQNNFGSVYVYLSFDQIEKIYEEIQRG